MADELACGRRGRRAEVSLQKLTSRVSHRHYLGMSFHAERSARRGSPASARLAPVAGLAPVAALVGSMTSLCVGTSYARTLFDAAGAAGTTAFRVGLAALLLNLLRRPWRRPLSRRDLRDVAIYGMVLGLLNLQFYLAIRTVPLGLTIAIEFAGPLAVALLSSRRLVDLVWVALAVTGLALLLPFGGGTAPLDPLGVAFALGAAACWALYILRGQRIGHLDGGQAVAIGMAVAALVVVPVGIASAGRTLLDPALVAAGAVVAVTSSALPYSLELYALRKLPRQTFSVLLSLEPAIGSLAGLVLLGQHLTLVQWLAMACIIFASAGATLGVRRRAGPPVTG